MGGSPVGSRLSKRCRHRKVGSSACATSMSACAARMSTLSALGPQRRASSLAVRCSETKISFSEVFEYDVIRDPVRGLAWPRNEIKKQGFNSYSTLQAIVSPKQELTPCFLI